MYCGKEKSALKPSLKFLIGLPSIIAVVRKLLQKMAKKGGYVIE